MAEIHVQTKKHNASNMTWVWIVLALVIIGAVVYYLSTRNKTADNTAPAANTTGHVVPASNPFDVENILRQQNTLMYLC